MMKEFFVCFRFSGWLKELDEIKDFFFPLRILALVYMRHEIIKQLPFLECLLCAKHCCVLYIYHLI